MRKKQVMPSMMNRKRGTFECASWSARSNHHEECLGGTRNGRGNREDPPAAAPCQPNVGTLGGAERDQHTRDPPPRVPDTRIEAPLAAVQCGGNRWLL